METTGSLFTSSKPSIQQPYENHSIVNSHEVKGHISAEAKRTNVFSQILYLPLGAQ